MPAQKGYAVKIGAQRCTFVFLLFFLCSAVSTVIAREQGATVRLSGIYEYVYEHNTRDLIENHYLEFRTTNGRLAGTYCGTSDDFDEAREGYLPGFFCAVMKDLVVRGPDISFEVEVTDADMLSEPVTPLKRAGKNAPWGAGLMYTRRAYSGRIRGDRIYIRTRGFDERIFRRISR